MLYLLYYTYYTYLWDLYHMLVRTLSGAIRSYLELSRAIWSYLQLAGAIWSSVELSGAIWSYRKVDPGRATATRSPVIVATASWLPDPGWQILASSSWRPNAGCTILATKCWQRCFPSSRNSFLVWGLALGSFLFDART